VFFPGVFLKAGLEEKIPAGIFIAFLRQFAACSGVPTNVTVCSEV
jgi:hypothetical protein